MIKTAINWWKFVFICLIIPAVFFAFCHPIFALQYQQCATNSSCSIGEFLYDDNYQTISVGTTCTLTSRYPNGDVLLNSVTMDVSADGYYSYSVGTSGLSNGVYRTQMCCLTGTENMCLDKTFEISTTSNSLVADIWAYPDRALTSFGTLISSIWSAPTRELSSSNLSNGTSLATNENISNIGSSLTVISTQVSAVQTDVTTINNKVDSLNTAISNLQTTTDNILAKWGSYSVTDILNYVDSLETQLGNNTHTCSDNSVFGQIKCLQDKWGSDSASTIATAANNAYSTASSIRSELNFNGKSTTAYDEIIALKAYVDTIEGSLGSSSDSSSAASIFGRVKQVKEAVDTIDSTTLDLTDLMNKWGTLSATDIYDKVKNLSSEISNINTVSNVSSILSVSNTNITNITEIKNQLLAMKAILDVNRTQLQQLSNKPIIKTWLEDGSVIFKHLITNPSKFFEQEVDFIYYFPPEVRLDNIIKKTESLEIKYDTSKNVYYASQNIKLKPNQTIIVEIEVDDIWTIPQEKINSIKKQADELFAPLKGTSYFAQGSTLHSDIFTSLDKIIALQKTAKNPEDKLKIFSDTKIEMDSINRQIESLKTIVASAGSIGTLSGYIGGVQTMAVWGIIVILVAGFVFLALYIRSLNPSQNKPPQLNNQGPKQMNNFRPPLQIPKNIGFYSLIALAALSAATGSTVLTFFIYNQKQDDEASNPVVLSAIATPTPEIKIEPSPIIENQAEESTLIPTPEYISPSPTIIPTTIPNLIPPSAEINGQKKVTIDPLISSFGNLRSTPNRNSVIVTKVLTGQELIVTEEMTNSSGEKWLNISFNQHRGWILSQLTKPLTQASATTTNFVASSNKIKINVPDRDTVYVYSKPAYDASITYKITTNQDAEILLETKRWVKVILTKLNIEGWISQDFIEKNIR